METCLQLIMRCSGETKPIWRLIKGRATTEPMLGPMKSGRCLERNRLERKTRDVVKALVSAAAMNSVRSLVWKRRVLVFLHSVFSDITLALPMCPRPLR